MKTLNILVASAIVAMLTCCSSGESAKEQPPVQPTQESVNQKQSIVRAERILSQFSSYDKSAQDSIMQANADVLTAALNVLNGGDLTAAHLKACGASDVVQIFTKETEKQFADISALESTLGNILANASTKGISIPDYKYATMVWGKPQSVMFCDSVAMIALNHYLGSNHEAYNGSPDYIKARKNADNIPTDLAEALLATSYPMEHNHPNSVLHEMIYTGAVLYIAKQLLGDATDAKILGYTPEEYAWCEDNGGKIWQKLANNQYLYSNDNRVIDRLFSPSPNTSIINPEAPGRLGRYVGYKIVNSYMINNPETSLATLLTPQFYNETQTLVKSGYQPK